MPLNTTPIPQLEHKLLNLVPNELVLIDSSFNICWYNNTFENNRIKPAYSHKQDELKSWLKNLLQSLFIEAWNFEKMHFEAILSQFPGIVNEPIDLSISKICQDQSEYLLISIIKSEALLSYSMKLKEYGAKYKALLDSAVDGIIIINHKGLIEVMNPAALRLFGYVKDEIKGQNISVLMNNPHKTNHDQYIQRFHTTGEKKIIGVGREVEGKRKDGQCFPFWLSVSEIKHLNETSFAGIIHDLTAQKVVEAKLKKYTHELESKVAKRTYELQVANNELKLEIDQKMAYEEALELSQNLYRTISRNFPNGTINVFDQDLNYVFAEGKALFELGITSEELIGTSYLKRLKPKVAMLVKDQLEQVFNGISIEFEIEQDQQFYTLNAVPLAGSNGVVRQILVVERNNTSQKMADIEIRNALKKERELSDLKSRFVSMASHEFRTPLSTILSSTNLLQRYIELSQADKIDKHVHRIINNVKHLTTLLNDFLSIGKLEEGKLLPVLQMVNIKASLTENIDEMKSMLKPLQKLKTHFDFDHNLELLVDKNMLKVVFDNLLSNAIKYSVEQSEIVLEAKVSDQNFELHVSDQGIGIPEDEQKLLFDLFFRASNATNIQGTGMGLNIVKKFLEQMQGHIDFKSQLGKGSTFSIYLPLRN